MNNKDTGLLLNRKDLELQRHYFNEMVKLLGINTIYKAPKKATKDYTLHGELDIDYEPGILVGCIFEEHPTIKTMKTLGWATQLSESSSVIHVPFDLKGLEKGGRFIIPSPYDSGTGRLFRVISISSTMIYPASFACEIAPEYETTSSRSEIEDFSKNNFNLLNITKEN